MTILLPIALRAPGGFGMPIEGHLYKIKKKSYSYGETSANPEELTKRIVEMYRKMVFPAIPKGLCGVIYTQLTDVEEEVNGIVTYDRQVLKVVPGEMAKLADQLCLSRIPLKQI